MRARESRDAEKRAGGASNDRSLVISVRDDIPGSRNLGSRDYWVRVRELGEWDSVLKRDQSRHGLRNGCSVISARAEHGRSWDPGLWVRNKEQWTDRRVMTAHTRVRWLRPVSRSSGIKEGAIS